MQFYWKVSSESCCDFLNLFVDGVNQGGAISGAAGFVLRTVAIASGSHTVEWRYSKDYSVSSGSDAAWVDQVLFTPSGGGSTSFTPSLENGFNLMGNSLNTAINVMSTFGNQTSPVAGVTSNVASVWKWDAVNGNWQFHSPLLTTSANATFAAGKGYAVLTSIAPGEGYWVNALNAFSLPAQSGTPFNYSGVNFAALVSGFNLISTATTATPSQFNVSVSVVPPSPGVVPTDNFLSLWAWDALNANWYFYSPLLESSGGLTAVRNYANSHNYLHFQDFSKQLGIGTGFWVLRP